MQGLRFDLEKVIKEKLVVKGFSRNYDQGVYSWSLLNIDCDTSTARTVVTTISRSLPKQNYVLFNNKIITQRLKFGKSYYFYAAELDTGAYPERAHLFCIEINSIIDSVHHNCVGINITLVPDWCMSELQLSNALKTAQSDPRLEGFNLMDSDD